MIKQSQSTPYLSHLIENKDKFQSTIENLLEQHEAQPVGSGYIDVIVSQSKAKSLLSELTQNLIAVKYVTWWCFCSQENQVNLGCPHGMGGPKNRFGEGYFSECVHYPDFDLAKQGLNFDDPALEPIELVNACNQILMKYIENNMHLEDFYSSCLHLGFWLHVPDDWKRYHYLT